jgi:hypothetical protein
VSTSLSLAWLDKMMRGNDVFVCKCAEIRQKDVILHVECASNAQEWKNKQNINTQNEKFYQVHNGNRGGYIPDHDVVHNHRHHLPGRNACHRGNDRSHQGEEHPAH